MKTNERDVLHACYEYLLLQGHKVWRQNNFTATTAKGGYIKSTGMIGVPDLVGCTKDGRFLGVECKSATGRQSKEQKMFETWITGAGGLYVLARCIEDLKRSGL